jgi:hypothetical protein
MYRSIYMTVLVEKIEPSTRKGKRFMAILTNGDRIHFGQKNSETYIDHNDTVKRKAYQERHFGNKRERELINSHSISPALLSMYITWGMFPTLEQNLDYLNSELEKKHNSAV